MTDKLIYAHAGSKNVTYLGGGLETAITKVGVNKSHLVIDTLQTLSADLACPANVFLIFVYDGMIDTNGNTLTINSPGHIIASPNQVIFTGTGSVAFTIGGDICAGWFATADGTDVSTSLQKMINSAPILPCRFLFNANSSGYGIGTALTLPTLIASTRLDWTFEGMGGKGKLIATAAVDIFNTYSLDQTPTYWTFGVTFKNLYLDGNSTGVNGFNLHGIALNGKIEDCVVTGFTNAGILLSRCLETELNNIYSYSNTEYQLYICDGTTLTIVGGSYRFGKTAFHCDGNLTEALDDVNSGPYDVLVLGGVFEASSHYGIHLTAGGRYSFIRSHFESIGYDGYITPTVMPYAVKIDNEGGENPRNVVFDHCVFSTDAKDIVLAGTYKWTASGSGTNEYYVELAAGGDPSLVEPSMVYENAVKMTVGTMGSLAASEWDYGDNDTLGYSTVYVRLSDGADPDSKADGYVDVRRAIFNLDRCSAVEFITCQDSGLRGGIINANTLYTKITAGTYINDFRNISTSNITDSSTTTLWIDDRMDYFKFVGGLDDYIRMYQNKILFLVRSSTALNVLQTRVSTSGVLDSYDGFVLKVDGTQLFGSGAAATDVEFDRMGVGALRVNAGIANYTQAALSVSNQVIVTVESGWNIYHLLTENTTIKNPNRSAVGTELRFIIQQAAAGGPFTVAFGNNYLLAGDAFTMTGTASSVDVITFIYNSSVGKWVEISRTQDVR